MRVRYLKVVLDSSSKRNEQVDNSTPKDALDLVNVRSTQIAIRSLTKKLF